MEMEWKIEQLLSLVALVKPHTCLWKKDDPQYNQAKFKREKWNEIGRDLNCSGLEVKHQWTLLMNRYRNHKNTIMYSTTYKGKLNPMFFLMKEMAYIEQNKAATVKFAERPNNKEKMKSKTVPERISGNDNISPSPKVSGNTSTAKEDSSSTSFGSFKIVDVDALINTTRTDDAGSTKLRKRTANNHDIPDVTSSKKSKPNAQGCENGETSGGTSSDESSSHQDTQEEHENSQNDLITISKSKLAKCFGAFVGDLAKNIFLAFLDKYQEQNE